MEKGTISGQDTTMENTLDNTTTTTRITIDRMGTDPSNDTRDHIIMMTVLERFNEACDDGTRAPPIFPFFYPNEEDRTNNNVLSYDHGINGNIKKQQESFLLFVDNKNPGEYNKSTRMSFPKLFQNEST
jgi:hypothetical protein